MKRFLSLALAVPALVLPALVFPAFGQSFKQSDNNASMMVFPTEDTRTEIIVPAVNGYNVIKADLHTHTYYSDGSVTPQQRISEAWRDGLDAVAITDHIEYRPNEKRMKDFLGIPVKESQTNEINSDLDYSCDCAESSARKFGITLIHGAEITRNHHSVGHFNLLFTTDNNLIPDSDHLQTIRNAKAQGAIVQSNHPGWRRQDNEFTDVAAAALKEGLIDGVEVFNTNEFYPDVIQRACEMGMYVCSGTDVHGSTYDLYGRYDYYRNMTLLLAADNSPESLRDALLGRRTLAYSYGNIAGSESLLLDFFNACVSIDRLYTDSKGRHYVKITNKSSFPFVVDITGRDHDTVVPKLGSIVFGTKEDALDIVVTNLWFGAGKHPVVKF